MGTTMLTWSAATPLDDYVSRPDNHYSFGFITSIKGPNYAVYILNMTSQKWLTEDVTTKPIWWHYLSIMIPNKLVYTDTAFLFIDGGDNTDQLPSMKDDSIIGFTSLAESTGAVCAVINQIPNQPTVFVADPKRTERYEDSIIAWTWKQFLDNGSNPEILLRLPMTKAVVRGMDTISTFSKTITGNTISKFVIGGESKRGWTTWTTAAVDKRVVGMVPTVMDLLNTQQNLHHHFRSLGGWTFAFDDYYNMNITYQLDSPNMPWLRAVIDPLTYFMRYTMPKLIVTSSGDEFFLPDDSYYYYDKLPEPKYLRIIPNAEHSLTGHQLSYLLTIKGFFLNILENQAFPNVTWVRTANAIGGQIIVTTSRPPRNVTVYHARTLSDGRRDFRLAVMDQNTKKPIPHPVLWQSGAAKQNSPTQFQADFERPLKGWTAFYIQLEFDGSKGSTLEFTTEVNIIPDTFPFPDCVGQTCQGTLV